MKTATRHIRRTVGGREKTLQVRLPEGLRSEADAVLEKIGIDMPTAVRIYLNKIVQTRGIPFKLEAPDVKVESIEVDDGTQHEMDAVAEVWQARKK